ncbi:MAG TPA: BMP family ABC transporter substrate-binding protein [Actinomycetota bacterium]|nr:BMP family ABC transporter substrate-binding protein [Actinomycetota bacterium]
MKRYRSRVLTVAGVVLGMMVAACGGGGGKKATPGGSPTPTRKFVYVSPNAIGVNQFLQLGKVGIERAGKQFGATTDVFESDDPTARQPNVEAAIREGATIVVMLGFEFNDIVTDLAPKNTNVQFLIVDQCIDKPPPNVHCVVFREYEATYLAGIEAGLLTKTNKIGAIGALDIPFLHRYTDPFFEGAKSANPNITKTTTLWVGGDNPFADPARSKEQALTMAAQGADQVMAATAGGNGGIFEAAKDKGFFTYGVDVNQCPQAPGFVVDNVVKQTDVAVVDGVKSVLKGGDQIVVLGLAEGGIGLTSLTPDAGSSQCLAVQHADVLDKVRQAKQDIIDGKIKIKDPLTGA